MWELWSLWELWELWEQLSVGAGLPANIARSSAAFAAKAAPTEQSAASPLWEQLVGAGLPAKVSGQSTVFAGKPDPTLGFP